MNRINTKDISFGLLKLVLPFFLLFVLVLVPLQPCFGWDAGTESRRHSEGTGGENPITILDTRLYWAESKDLNNSGRVSDCPAGYTNTGYTCYQGPNTYSAPSVLANCPAGYTNMGLDCQKGANIFNRTSTMVCPSGYFMGAAKRCYQNCKPGYTNNGEFCGKGADSVGVSSMTCLPGEERVQVSVVAVPRCYQKPVCPPNKEYWGFRCYISAPGVRRTAVSTVVMDVKQSGNTHLWIVNCALDLLARSDDPGARAFAAKMNETAIREAWENGLWDGDGPDYADASGNMGTHFYNPAGKDWKGDATSLITYDFVKGSIIPIVGGIAGAALPVAGAVVAGSAAAAGAAGAVAGSAGTLAVGQKFMSNKQSCSNSRECAKAQIARLNAELNTANAWHLGLALHYMTDATQPMHTSGYDGFKIPNNLHPQYEYYAAYVQGKSPSSNMTWDKRWYSQTADDMFYQAGMKSNGLAPRLTSALHMGGDAGIVTIQSFNGIGPYTGYNIYHDAAIDRITDVILRDAYQSTASYLYGVSRIASGSTAVMTMPAPTAAVRDLTGNWIGFYSDGRRSVYVWAISQTGTTLAITDVGAGSGAKSRGRIEGNRVSADDFGTIGTLSADGRTIVWNDKVYWVKQ